MSVVKCLNNDFCLKLRGESSLFCHRIFLSIGLLLYHNLSLDNGLNFRWQNNIGETNLLHGESLPQLDPTCTDPDVDLEEPTGSSD